jgi:hypothetical protein
MTFSMHNTYCHVVNYQHYQVIKLNELELPSNAKTHPIFYISKLKPFTGPPPPYIPPLVHSGLKKQLLVQWQELPESEATREEEDHFLESYP